MAAMQPLALATLRVDLVDPDRYGVACGLPGAARTAPVPEAKPHRAGGCLLRQLRQGGVPTREQRIPHRHGDPAAEAHLRAHGVGEAVDPRHAFGIGAAQAGQPEYGPLDRDGRVGPSQLNDRLGRSSGQPSRCGHRRGSRSRR